MVGCTKLDHMDRRDSISKGIPRDLLVPSSLQPGFLPNLHLLQFLQRVENTVKFGDCFLGNRSCC